MAGYLPVGMDTDPNSIIDTQLQLNLAHSSSKSMPPNLQVQQADSAVSSTQPPANESGSSNKSRPGHSAPADAQSAASYSTFSSSSDSEQELAAHRAAHNARRKTTTELKGYARRVVVRGGPALPRISGSSAGSNLSQPQLQQAAVNGIGTWRLGSRRLGTAENSSQSQASADSETAGVARSTKQAASEEHGASLQGQVGGESESAKVQTSGVQPAMSELEVMLAEAVQLGTRGAQKQRQDKAQPIAGSPEARPNVNLPLASSGLASQTGNNKAPTPGSGGHQEQELEDRKSFAAASRRARLLQEAHRIMKQGTDFGPSRI